MRSDADRETVVSIAAGVLGALLAGRLLAPLLGGGPDRGFLSATPLLASVFGAIAPAGLVNGLKGGRLR